MAQNSFSLIQELVKCLSGIEVGAFYGIPHVVEAFHHRFSVDLSLPEFDRDLETELKKIRSGCIYEISAVFHLHFLIIYDQVTECYLVAGPCLMEKPAENEIRPQIREITSNQQSRDRILLFLQRVPVISYEVFHQLGDILVRSILDDESPIPYQRINYQWNLQQKQSVFFTDHYAELSQIRMVEVRYENSAAFTEAVKCGNLSLAYRFLNEMGDHRDAMVRNPDPLRNSKNMCIVLNTQLRYALESIGIHPFLLDQVSGEIGLHIESLRSMEEGTRFVADVIRQYCELAQKHAFPNLNPFVHLAVTYIKSHLNENLTVKDTARALLVNPDYLSHKFRTEMGISFIDFLNQQRTAQAAALLTRSSLQIQQISSAVGYNNTSYFSKQFSRFYHTTPKDYRKNASL